MKQFRYILFAFAFVQFAPTMSFAQNKGKLRSYLDCKQFYSHEAGNYIEVYFQFVGPSLHYLPKDNGLIGEVGVILNISQGDSIIRSDAYRLATPFMKDSIVEDFYDMKRFAIQPGNYSLNIELFDVNDKSESLKASVPITIEELADGVSFSDIETAELIYNCDGESPFSKSGVCIIPRLATFYPTELENIPVYFELYNTSTLADSVFAIKQFIVDEAGNELTEQTVFTRHQTAEIVPIVRKVDITKVKSGKYTLSFALLSKKMTELAIQTYEFDRSNDLEVNLSMETTILDPNFQASIPEDSIVYYLESLIPISGASEIKNIIKTIKTKDADLQRKHIQAFWVTTAKVSAYDEWLSYKEQVKLVEARFGNNFQEGFETDRGRVYLQYGSPTTMVQKETSPSEYPYEIWQYNQIGKFSNKRFVFYNPDLVNNTYRLIHSDMIGELKNPGWPQMLSKRNSSAGNVDNQNEFLQKQYGDNSNDLFRQY